MKRRFTESANGDFQLKIPKMEEHKFVLFPRLERMSLIVLITKFYRLDDIQSMLNEIFQAHPIEAEHGWRKLKFDHVAHHVTQKVKPYLPKSIEDVVYEAVAHVGYNLLQALEFQRFKLRCNVENDEHPVFWTPYGSIDYSRMVKSVLDDDRTSLDVKYLLACEYCMKDYVITLGYQLPNHVKLSFQLECITKPLENHLLSYWIYDAIGSTETDNPHTESSLSRNEDMANCTVRSNKAAFRYFWKRLSIDKKRLNVLSYATIPITTLEDADIVIFMLSQMDAESQKDYFLEDPFYSLYPFVKYWQWRYLLPDAVALFLNHIPLTNFSPVMHELTRLIHYCEDPEYILLILKTLLLKSTAEMRQNLLQNRTCTLSVLKIMFHLKSHETMQVVFRGASNHDRKQLVYSQELKARFIRSMKNEEFQFLDALFDLTLYENGERKTFKEILFFDRILSTRYVRENSETFDKILRWVFSTESEVQNIQDILEEYIIWSPPEEEVESDDEI